jgi:hypothetical protein
MKWILSFIGFIWLLYLTFKHFIDDFIITVYKGKKQKELQDRAHEQKREIQDIEYKYKLSLTDLKKRLEVHQDAYKLGSKLETVLGDKEEVRKAFFECQDWYIQHCLYLTPKASDAFIKAYNDALLYQTFFDGGRKEKLEELFDSIRQLRSIIRQEVSFLSPLDVERIKKPEEDI